MWIINTEKNHSLKLAKNASGQSCIPHCSAAQTSQKPVCLVRRSSVYFVLRHLWVILASCKMKTTASKTQPNFCFSLYLHEGRCDITKVSLFFLLQFLFLGMSLWRLQTSVGVYWKSDYLHTKGLLQFLYCFASGTLENHFRHVYNIE